MEKTEMEKLGESIALARAQIAVLREENALMRGCLFEMSGADFFRGGICSLTAALAR